MPRPDLRRHGLPVALVVLAVLVVIARVLVDPAGRLVGHSLGEASSHLWIQWWLDRALFGGMYPFGQEGIVLDERVWVMPSDWTTRVLVGPLGWLVGRVAAYNVGVVWLLLLAGLGTMLLARRAGASVWPAVAAGLVVVWHPSLLGFASDGRIDSMGVGWAALVAWAWLGVIRTPSVRAGLVLGACAAGAVLSSVNLTVAVSLAALVPTAVVMLTRPACRVPILAGAGVAATVSAIVLGTLVHVERNDPGRLMQQSHPEGRALVSVADPGSFLVEFWVGAQSLHHTAVSEMWSLPEVVANNPSTHRAAGEMVLQLYAPGGWWFISGVCAALVLVGLLRAPKMTAPWAAAGVILQVLALGYGPSQTLPLGIGTGTYYYLSPGVLLEKLPGLSAFNNYGIFGILATLSQAVAGAIGLSHLKRPALWTALAVVFWLIEVQVRSPVPLPLPATDARPPTDWVSEIVQTDSDEGVLVLPVSEHTWLLQTYHHRPSILRFRPQETEGARIPLYADRTGNISAFVYTVIGRNRRANCDLSGTGLGAVVILTELLPESLRDPTIQRVEACLGRADAVHGTARFYHLP